MRDVQTTGFKRLSTYSNVICGNKTANTKASCTLKKAKRKQTLMLAIFLLILHLPAFIIQCEKFLNYMTTLGPKYSIKKKERI